MYIFRCTSIFLIVSLRLYWLEFFQKNKVKVLRFWVIVRQDVEAKENNLKWMQWCLLSQEKPKVRIDLLFTCQLSSNILIMVFCFEESGGSCGLHKKQSKIVYDKNKTVTDKKSSIAYQRAKAFKSKNPFIVSFMQPSYISKHYILVTML